MTIFNTVYKSFNPIFTYDFTQSAHWFSWVWSNDNYVSYWQNSGWLFCSTNPSGNIWVEVFSMPSEVYTLDIKKIEISFNCSSSNSGWGICSTSGDSWDWIRVWKTWSEWLQKSISGSSSSLTSVPTPSWWYTLTIDFDNWSAYTDTSNDILTLTSTEVNTLKQEINNGTIWLVIIKNGWPSIAYITNAKFYY